MHTEDIPRYAAAVVGFPIYVGMKVTVEEECLGIARDGKEYTSFKGAEAEVLAIRLLPLPDQLTVTLKIAIDPEEDLYIEEMFTEGDPEPVFPFAVPKTQEQIELERAEAGVREAARAFETTAKANTQATAPKTPTKSHLESELEEEEAWRRAFPGYGCH